MRKLIFIIILFPSFSFGDGPIFKQKDTYTQQEFENAYQDIRAAIHNPVFYDAIQVSSAATGGGTATLGTNCPASVTTPTKWLLFKSSDGTQGYIPWFKK